jgi:hypothetical protein
MMRVASQRQAGRTEVADGADGPHIRVAANIPNNEIKRVDKGWSSSLGFDEGLRTRRIKLPKWAEDIQCLERKTSGILIGHRPMKRNQEN